MGRTREAVGTPTLYVFEEKCSALRPLRRLPYRLPAEFRPLVFQPKAVKGRLAGHCDYPRLEALRAGQFRMNSSCSAVSTAPGRTERTLAIASMPSGAQPVSMRSIDATVPARPRPPLQCTTILLPDKSSAANWGPVDCHGRSSRASGAAPSLIGRPCHIKPCALARSAKEVIRSSSNSHGSINVIRCCAPHATIDARSISKSRAQDPVIATS